MMCDQHIRLRDSSVWDCGSALSRRSGTQLEVNTVKVKNQLLIWFEYTNEMSVVLCEYVMAILNLILAHSRCNAANHKLELLEFCTFY